MFVFCVCLWIVENDSSQSPLDMSNMNSAHSRLYVSSRFMEFNFLKSGLKCAVCFSKNMILAAFLRLLFRRGKYVAQAPSQFNMQ